MKKVILVLLVIFLLWMCVGGYLISINHSKGQLTTGLGVFFMAFILMPTFIYYRYKDGKYKKYQIKDDLFKPNKQHD